MAWRLLLRTVLYTIGIVALLVLVTYVYYLATLYRAGEPHAGYLALTGATVLVGEELEPRRDTAVLVQDGIIVAVEGESPLAIPAGATVIDLSGYTLLPGLMDLHVHLGAPELEVGQQMGPAQMPGLIFDALRFVPNSRRGFLAHGVTTVRDVGNDLAWVMELRQQLRGGELEGPRLFAAGPIFTAPGGHPVATVYAGDPALIEAGARLPGNTDEASRMVRELAVGEHPVDLIKVVQERGRPATPLEPIAPDVLQAIVAEAHAHGLLVFVHWGTHEDLQDVLAAGVDGLEHIGRLLDGWPGAVLATLVEQEVSMTPTLAVMEVKLAPARMQPFMQKVAEFHSAGGRVVVGSDAGMPGVPFGAGVHRELELLVESGLTPQEALQAATSQAAKVLRADHLGVIAPGRAADLVVVDGDPLQAIQAVRNVVLVFRDGRLVVDRR